ncbi:MAG: AMP-binding protein [Planctomycetota bacterium]|nr:AMP-binding protein [Planctomycetota bacterium]
MDADIALLLDALRRRGTATFLEDERGVVSGAALADEVAAAMRTPLPIALEPGDVVALQGGQARVQITAPLVAWARGLCTQLVGARETPSSVDGLLVASGARAALQWEEPGLLTGIALSSGRRAALPTGTLLATSGSLGRPRLVLHGLGQHIASARAAAAFLGLDGSDRLLVSLPMWHVGGLALLFRALASGAVLCVPPRHATLADALVQLRPTRVSLVATQLRRALDDPEALAGLRACRTVLLGGGPAPVTLRTRALAAGVPLAVGYGATETAAFVVATTEPAIVAREDTAGRALPGNDVQVDARGHILVAGPGVLSDYYGPTGRTLATDSAGRWDSGDLGHLQDGVLRVTGRADRRFISGGENIQPEAIEEVLLGAAGVSEAIVVPVPSEEFGERPVAFVAGEPLTLAALEAAVRAALPGFHVPAAWYRLPPPEPGPVKRDLHALAAMARDPVAAARLQPLT